MSPLAQLGEQPVRTEARITKPTDSITIIFVPIRFSLPTALSRLIPSQVMRLIVVRGAL
jgi:hypothetical protein